MFSEEVIDELHSIETECFKEKSFSRKILQKIINNPDYNIEIHKDNDIITGFIIFGVTYDPRIIGMANTPLMYIFMITIREAYRRTDIGKNFMEIVMAKSRSLNISNIYLHVWTENTDAISFYEKVGFEQVKFLDNYYRGNGDAYLMKLTV